MYLLGVAGVGVREDELADVVQQCGDHEPVAGVEPDLVGEALGRAPHLDEVVRAESAKRPKVVFIDTWRRFSGRNGGWAEYVVDPRDGEGKAVRREDGFHLNVTGAEILALDIAEVIKNDLRTRGAQI